MANNTLFIFRRDLRISDNRALREASLAADNLYLCFIFDPRQIDEHPYRSQNGAQFLIESLEELDSSVNGRLNILYGIAEEVVGELIKSNGINSIVVSADYTPFSLKRDKKIKDVAENHGASFVSVGDGFLNEPGTVLKDSKEPYTVFTPFWKKAKINLISRPVEECTSNFHHIKSTYLKSIGELRKKYLQKQNKDILVSGGRKNGLRLLTELEKLRDYKSIRDIPAILGTSAMSAHMKFGTISVREFYWKVADLFGLDHDLIRQLYWRDFFSHISYHYPHVYSGAFHKKYDSIQWDNDLEMFELWCDGNTGFPIVDAGMRQLNATGFMHNRVRMITASFLVKDLHIDWRWGERYFAQKLTDYDPAVNNGSWQWVASTGCDAQPYFRIFNPWLQQAKFDPDAKFIKSWIPELVDLNPKEIHKLHEELRTFEKYPKPLVDHAHEKKVAEERYSKAL